MRPFLNSARSSSIAPDSGSRATCGSHGEEALANRSDFHRLSRFVLEAAPRAAIGKCRVMKRFATRLTAFWLLIFVLAGCGSLGETSAPVAEVTAGFPWQFAGLAQLDQARISASERSTKVLVGLSGSPG